MGSPGFDGPRDGERERLDELLTRIEALEALVERNSRALEALLGRRGEAEAPVDVTPSPDSAESAASVPDEGDSATSDAAGPELAEDSLWLEELEPEGGHESGDEAATPEVVDADRTSLDDRGAVEDEDLEPEPAAAGSEPGRSAPASSVDLEARVGAWLGRLGLVALIIGFALLGRYVTPRLEPWHKVALTFLGAAVLVAIGHVLERRSAERRVRLFAHGLVAGGLALAFSASAASYFFEPMACLPLAASLALMTASVVAILVYADRWRSPTVAGLAIFLGNASAVAAGGRSDLYSLVMILSLTTVALVLVLRRDWMPLGLFSVFAAFGGHFLWAIQDHEPSTPETRFWVNFLFLTSYYAIYLGADLVFRRRLAARGRDAYSRVVRVAGAVTEPSALVLYATFVAALFEITEIYSGRPWAFYFPLAALQGGLCAMWSARRRGEGAFQGAVAVLFATLGLFSLTGGLTLDLSLVAEALLLVIVARLLGVWFALPLGRVVLATQAVHFIWRGGWSIEDVNGCTGAVAAAFGWMLHALFSETHRTEPGLFRAPTRPWAIALRDVSRALAPVAAHLQAIVGAVLAVVALAWLEAPYDGLAVASAALAVAVSAALLGSGALSSGAAALVAGTLVLVGGHRLIEWTASERAVSGGLAWRIDGVVAFASVAAAWCLARAARGWTAPRHGLAALVALVLAGGTAVVASGAGAPAVALAPLWAAVPVILWIETELAARALRARSGGARIARIGPTIALAVLAAVTTIGCVVGVAEGGGLAPALLGVWVLALALVSSTRPASWLAAGAALVGLWIPVHLTASWVSIEGAGEGLRRIVDGRALLGLSASALAALVVIARARPRRDLLGALAACGLLAPTTLILLGGVRAPVDSPWIAPALFALPFAHLVVGELLRGIPMVLGATSALGGGRRRDPAAEELPAALVSGLGAVLVVKTTGAWLDSGVGFIVAASLVSAMLLVVSVLRRSPAAAVGVLIVSCAVFARALAGPPGIDRLVDDAPWALALATAVILAEAVVAELVVVSLPDRGDARRGFALIGAFAAWGAASILGAFLFGARAEELVSVGRAELVGIAIWAGVLAGIARALRFTGPAFAAAGVAVTMLLYAALVAVLDASHAGGLFASTAVAVIFVILIERLALPAPREAGRGETGHETTPHGGVHRSAWTLTLVVASALALVVSATSDEHLRGTWTTAAWSAAALVLASLGFLWRSPQYRRTGLAVFALAVLRLVIVDTAGLETFYRMLAYIGLGVSLLLVSYLYARYADRLREWL